MVDSVEKKLNDMVKKNAKILKPKPYDVHEDRREFVWKVNIKVPLKGTYFDITVKSRKWSVTRKWMSAKIFSDIKWGFLTAEESIKMVEAFAYATKWAIEMDCQNAPLGPTEV